MSLEKMAIMYVVFQESNFAARGFNIIVYYMAGSASGQDESNPAL